MRQHDTFLTHTVWHEPFLVLLAGGVLMILLASLATRLTRGASWHRTIWRATCVGLLLLVLVEVTGTGNALVRLLNGRLADSTTHRELTRGPDEGREEAQFRDATWTPGTSAPHHRPWRALPAADRLEREAVALSTYRIEGYVDKTNRRQHDESDSAMPQRDGSASNRGTALVPAVASDATRPTTWRRLAENKDESPSRKLVQRSLHADGAAAGPLSDATRDGKGSSIDRAHAWSPGVLWSIGCLAILAPLGCRRTCLYLFQRRLTKVQDTALSRRVEALARQLDLRVPTRLLVSGRLRTPVAFGVWHPTVVLPVRFADQFDRNHQDAMLAHELAHLAGRDPLWNIVADLTCAALWWHPGSWMARCALRRANELAADEASLLVPGGPDLLAACLVAMGRRLSSTPRLDWLSVEGGRFRSGLGRRVQRLLNLGGGTWHAPRRRRHAVAGTVMLLALLLAAVMCSTWARPRETFLAKGADMSVFTSCWRQSLAATLVLGLVGAVQQQGLTDEVTRPDTAVTKKDGTDPLLARADEEGLFESAAEGSETTDDAAEADPSSDLATESEGETREKQHRRVKRETRRESSRRRATRTIQRELEELEQEADSLRQELSRRPDNEQLRFSLRKHEEQMERIHREMEETDGNPFREVRQRWNWWATAQEKLRSEAKRRDTAAKKRALEQAERSLKRRQQLASNRAKSHQLKHRQALLHAAVANLREAGLEDQAAQVFHTAQQLAREIELSEKLAHERDELTGRMEQNDRLIRDRMERAGYLPRRHVEDRVREYLEAIHEHEQVVHEHEQAAHEHEQAAHEHRLHRAEAHERHLHPEEAGHRRGDLEREVEQLRGEVEQLHRQLDEVRRLLEEMSDRGDAEREEASREKSSRRR